MTTLSCNTLAPARLRAAELITERIGSGGLSSRRISVIGELNYLVCSTTEPCSTFTKLRFQRPCLKSTFLGDDIRYLLWTYRYIHDLSYTDDNGNAMFQSLLSKLL